MLTIENCLQKVCSPEERNCRDGGSFPLVHLSAESIKPDSSRRTGIRGGNSPLCSRCEAPCAQFPTRAAIFRRLVDCSLHPGLLFGDIFGAVTTGNLLLLFPLSFVPHCGMYFASSPWTRSNKTFTLSTETEGWLSGSGFS